jgi:hypothetical protein
MKKPAVELNGHLRETQLYISTVGKARVILCRSATPLEAFLHMHVSNMQAPTVICSSFPCSGDVPVVAWKQQLCCDAVERKHAQHVPDRDARFT